MAFFSAIEREMIEDAFDMKGGYVLDFTNQTFADFIEENLGFDPYKKPQYSHLSKAKILLAILKDESDSFAGKLILALIKFRQFKQISNQGDKYIPKLIELGNHKLGQQSNNQSSITYKESKKSQFNPEQHLATLLAIEDSQKSPQQKGYAFEKFLNQLFQDLSLSPRASYRTESDQIDGSFLLDGNTILLEAKYRSSSPSKNDLILFSEKIANKSQFARGLFICQAKIPCQINDYYKDREGTRIIAMTVEELYLILSENADIVDIIRRKFRYLDEMGIVFKYYRELI